MMSNDDAYEEYWRRGNELYDEGHLDEAISEWREAVNRNPAFLDLRFNIGSALWQQDKTDAALHEWQAVLERDPNHPETLQCVAHAYFRRAQQSKNRADWQTALEVYRRVLPLRPQDAELLGTIGYLENELGNRAIARDFFEAAIAADPNHEDYYRRLFDIQWKMRDWRGVWHTAFAQSRLPNRARSPYPTNYHRLFSCVGMLLALLICIFWLAWTILHR